MTSFRIRPKFELEINKSSDQIIKDFKNKLQQENACCKGIAMQDHITLRMKIEEVHFWSPQLSVLLIEDTERQKTQIIGVYGPMPNVWTIFAVSYLAIIVLSLFIGIIGFSQLSLGLESNILWSLPILAVLAVFMYLVSQFGQKLGAEQTYTLHHFFEEAIGHKIQII